MASLLGLSLAGALFTLTTLEERPRAQRIGLQVASLVNLTRTALVSSQAQLRGELLDQIAKDEGAKVRLLEPTDQVEQEGNRRFFQSLLNQRLIELLGPQTKTAFKVNGAEGFWVSFNIDTDQYWLQIEPQRLLPGRPNFVILGGTVVFISALAAYLLSRVVNRPLEELASAINQMANGGQAPKLSEKGPSELALLNRQFNRLAADLDAIEADRSLALAGISHDLRTPLTRLRLELELSSRLSEEERKSMSEEIERMDQIVGQFIEFARVRQTGGTNEQRSSPREILDRAIAPFRLDVERGNLKFLVEVKGLAYDKLSFVADQMAIERILSNGIINALRYGQTEGTTPPCSDVLLRIEANAADRNRIAMTIADNGPGVPKDQFERLLRPFARLDSERNMTGGSGLGLAIVERLARRLDGKVELKNAIDPRFKGLAILVEFNVRDVSS